MMHDHPGAENAPLLPPGSGHEGVPFHTDLDQTFYHSWVTGGTPWIHAPIGAEQSYRSACQLRSRPVHLFHFSSPLFHRPPLDHRLSLTSFVPRPLVHPTLSVYRPSKPSYSFAILGRKSILAAATHTTQA